MMRKEGIITVMVCVIFILVGTIGFSFLYQMLFQPEKRIEEPLDDGEWIQVKEEQEKKILYPFSVWKEKESILDRGKVIWEDNFYQGYGHADMFQTISELVGIKDYSKMLLQDDGISTCFFYGNSSESIDYGLHYILYFTQIQSQTDELIIVINNNGMPVFCQYNTKKKEEGKQNTISEQVLSAESVPQRCYEDLRRVDAAFENEDAYHLLQSAVSDDLFNTGEVSIGSFSLICKQYGEWRYYTDEEREAFVCVLNTNHIILYYDKESHQFCGYSFAQIKME